MLLKGNLIDTLYGHTFIVTSIILNSNNNKIISGSWDKNIIIWDINTGENINTLTRHNGYVNKLIIRYKLDIEIIHNRWLSLDTTHKTHTVSMTLYILDNIKFKTQMINNMDASEKINERR